MILRLLLLSIFIISCTKSFHTISLTQTDTQLHLDLSQYLQIKRYQIRQQNLMIYEHWVNENLRQLSIPISNLDEGKYTLLLHTEESIDTIDFTIAPMPKKTVFLQFPIGGNSYSIFTLPDTIDIHFDSVLQLGVSSFVKLNGNHAIQIQMDTMVKTIQIADQINILRKVNFAIDQPYKSMQIRYLHNDSLKLNTSIIIRKLSIADLEESIEISEIKIPTNSNGDQFKYEQNFELMIPDKLIDKFQSFLNESIRIRNQNSPFTYLSLTIVNNLNSDQLIYGQLIFKDLITEDTLDIFKSKNWMLNGVAEYSTSAIYIPAHTQSNIVLPVYINLDLIDEGSYNIDIELSQLGNHNPFKQIQRTLKVNRHNTSLVILYIFITLIGLGYLFWFFWNLKLTLSEFKIETLITIAIFSSIHFTFGFIAQMFDSSFLAILGPFRIFISNFFTECLTYTILVSLYYMYPKKGVISLKLLISFLLSMVLTGGGVLLTIVNTAFLMVLLEVAFSFSKTVNRFILFSMLGIIDALISYIQIIEMKLFYRLIYSDWYVYLMIFIVGYLYTLIGSYFGFKLSIHLKKVLNT